MSKILGVILIDHGSRQEESNQAFFKIVERLARRGQYPIVEPAHMELSSPTLAEAFDRAVARGATELIVHPYFLLPGKHWHVDIPRLCEDASKKHPGVRWKVTPPLGESDLILDLVVERIEALR